jgi:hypothetical protein
MAIAGDCLSRPEPFQLRGAVVNGRRLRQRMHSGTSGKVDVAINIAQVHNDPPRHFLLQPLQIKPRGTAPTRSRSPAHRLSRAAVRAVAIADIGQFRELVEMSIVISLLAGLRPIAPLTLLEHLVFKLRTASRLLVTKMESKMEPCLRGP